MAAETCEAILEAFSTPFKVGAYSITIGTSIGYFESDTSCDSAEEFIRKADVAMYAAKDAGRNCARVYHPSLDEGHEGASGSSRISSARSRTKRSTSAISRSSMPSRARSSPSRRWRAGLIPSMAMSRRTCSFLSPRSAG